ncbi:MAG TPA: putative sulfate exporter family transporter [Candidatus Lustribacter sp.]
MNVSSAPSEALRGFHAPPILPGVLVAAAIALLATLLARFVPLIGAPVLAIVLGIVLRLLVPLPQALRAGFVFSAKQVLQLAIIVSGFGLSLAAVAQTGWETLPVTVGTIAVALVLAPLVGRLLKIDTSLERLIGIGTAICGASAIAAVASVIEPLEADVALAIATIFFYNVVAVFAFPALGGLMHLTQNQFGVWAGTAINDTSSVVAAGYAFGSQAGQHATIVKLTRATFILPIVAIVAVVHARAQHAGGVRVAWRKVVPWFILWFVVAACINTTGIVPSGWHPGITQTSTFLISTALAAIGVQTEVARLARSGARPLALGFVLWVAVAVVSLLLQRATGS